MNSPLLDRRSRRKRHSALTLVAIFIIVLYIPRLLTSAETGPTDRPTTGQVESAQPSEEGAVGEEGHGGGGGAHGGEMTRILASLFILLLAAKLGGELLERIGQPAVLGELAFGVVIGNLGLVGFHDFEYLKHDLTLEILAEIGVILLLFEVGLESNLKEMASVGASSFLVAVLGVVAPFFLGWGVAAFFWKDLLALMENDTVREAIRPHGMIVQVFIGAVLCATSVGITARVLKDMGKLQTRESRIILGAAVFDDVLGLIILAVCTGVVAAVAKGDAFNAMKIAYIVGVSVAFFVVVIVAGLVLAKPLYRWASYLRVHGVLLTSALLICFLTAWASAKIGLAPIVGAFAAGLILEEVHFRDLPDHKKHSLEELLVPLTTFLTPIFFVRMGITVDLASFQNVSILGFAVALTFAAIIGKQICSLGVLEKGTDRISVGLGMIPRGEVGLIFANVGAGLYLGGHAVIDKNVLSAVVIMVMITTMVTPPVLKWKFSRRSSPPAQPGG